MYVGSTEKSRNSKNRNDDLYAALNESPSERNDSLKIDPVIKRNVSPVSKRNQIDVCKTSESMPRLSPSAEKRIDSKQTEPHLKPLEQRYNIDLANALPMVDVFVCYVVDFFFFSEVKWRNRIVKKTSET